eukprot:9467101-Pyramimonas_sp.AAC.1
MGPRRPSDPRQAIASEGEQQPFLSKILHQISFRYCVNLTASPLEAGDAARLIMRGLATPDEDYHEESEDEELRDDEPPRANGPNETAAWT